MASRNDVVVSLELPRRIAVLTQYTSHSVVDRGPENGVTLITPAMLDRLSLGGHPK